MNSKATHTGVLSLDPAMGVIQAGESGAATVVLLAEPL